MTLLEFRDFLNGIPDDKLQDVTMVAAKVYQLDDEINVRLDMPILNFFIDPDTKEGVFEVKADQAGLDHILNISKEANDETNTRGATTAQN